jgi:predicted TIM-barrel fold metal-dependent hydrolase
MKVIDSHMHLGLNAATPASVLKEMDRKGIEQTWLLTWEELSPPVEELHMDLPPDTILEAVDRHPDRFVAAYAPDPSRENLQAHFQNYLDKGIRICGELKVSRLWSDPLLESYLEMVQKHRLPLVIHMEEPSLYFRQEGEGFFPWILERLMNDKYNGLSRYYLSHFAHSTGILKRKIRLNRVPFPGVLYDFDALEKRIRQFPGIRFIGHGPGFWNRISMHMDTRQIHQKGRIGEFGIIDDLLEKYDNLYCDISGNSGFNALNRDKKAAGIFLQKHAAKVLYGSDNTSFRLMELLHSLKPGRDALADILSGNAEKVLNL